MKTASTEQLVHILLLFAERDNTYKLDLEAHLSMYLQSRNVWRLRQTAIDQLMTRPVDLPKLVDQYSVVICLLSTHFLAHASTQNRLLQELAAAHRLKKVHVVPIYLESLEETNNPLRKIVRLPSNNIPFNMLQAGQYRRCLPMITHDIGEAVDTALAFEYEHDTSWQATSRANRIDRYRDFILKYPYSKYQSTARQQRNELVEEKLWREATAINTPDHYIRYLTHTPLSKYKKEAIDRIVEIENSEPIVKQDVVNNPNLGMLMNYKMRFRNEGAVSEINNIIFNIFNKPVEAWFENNNNPFTIDEDPVATESYQLKRQIHEQCTAAETFTLELLDEFSQNLKMKIRLLKEKTLKDRKENLFNFTFGVLSLVFLFFFINNLGTDPYAQSTGPWIARHPILTMLPFIAIAGWVWLVINSITKEQQLCIEKLSEIEAKRIELKVAFLVHDKKQKAQVALFLHNTDEWAEDLRVKTLPDYFSDKEHQEQSKEKVKPIEAKLK